MKYKITKPNIKIDKSVRFSVFGLFEVFAGIKRVGFVNGVNSFPAGEDPKTSLHILQWDFDAVKPVDAVTSLRMTQIINDLGTIFVLDTQKEHSNPEVRNLHAFCFATRFGFQEAFRVVEDTPFVCETYLKMAYVRGYFTLRFSPKNGRTSTLFATLPSPNFRDGIEPRSVDSYVRYRTKVA